MGFARGITGSTTDNLYDFSQAGTVTNGQRVFAPYPVKSFFSHAQRNDNVNIVLISFYLRRAKACLYPRLLIWVDEVSNSQGSTTRCLDQLKACSGVSTFPLSQLLNDVLYLLNLVASARARVHVWNVNDGFFSRIKHFQYVV